MEEKDRKFLKELIETKRVEIQYKGVNAQIARRLIKVKRRGGVGAGFGAVQK